MRLFDVGESTVPGWKLHKRPTSTAQQLFLPVGSPGSGRYLCLRAGRSLWEEMPETLEHARLTRDRYGVYCLARPHPRDARALVRACVASTADIPVTYEFSPGALVLLGGVFGTEPPVPMYLIEMSPGSAFRWQRGHDGVVYHWDGVSLRERRGTELPS